MAVDTTDPQYDAHLPLWHKLRDVVAGEERVRAGGASYLPRPTAMDDKDYADYVNRTPFFNATARTVDGLSGMVFRKPPQVETPGAMDAFLDDVDHEGTRLQGFAEQLVEELLVVSRAGVLVDFPQVEPDDSGRRTAADATRENLRPMWKIYRAESIGAHRLEQRNNRTTLTQVRVFETVREPTDEFEDQESEQIRVLELVEVDGRQVYRQRLFRKDAKGQWQEFGEPIVPRLRGAPLDFIPFIFVGPRDTTPAINKPLLLDLANVNLRHYQVAADHAHGMHFSLPTVYVFGVEENNFPKEMGAGVIWTSTKPDAQAGMLEFKGDGLGYMERELTALEHRMALLGARILAGEKRQVEAAETALIHRTGENSVLASLAQSASIAMTRALEIARDWMGASGEVSVDLNRDFMPTGMDPQMLVALLQAWQSGGISQRTLFENLKRGEIIDAESSFEDEASEIETAVPPGMPFRLGPAEGEEEAAGDS